MPYYAGIGSRSTPSAILSVMEEIAKKLAARGFVLRSGGAVGADEAFERGVDSWYTFMQASQGPVPKEIFYARDVDQYQNAGLQAMAMAEKYHGAWDRLNPFVRKLHARNVFQIMGRDLNTPVKFVVCWTRDGAWHHKHRTIATGGTGTAISVASMNNIPVFNLAQPEHLKRIMSGLEITH